MDPLWTRTASRLHRLIKYSPWGIVAAGLVLAALSLLAARGRLEFWTERNVLLSQESPSAQRYRAFKKEFQDDYLLLVLTSRDLDRAKRFAAALGERLEADPVPVQEVFYRIPPEQFRRQALLFLDPEELETLRDRISRHRELLARLSASPDLSTLLRVINEQISRALVRTAVSGLFAEESEAGEEERSEVDPEDLRLLSALMESLQAWLADARDYRSPWGALFHDAGGLSEDGYLVDEERGWVFMLAFLKDVEGSFNREGNAIERIRAHVEAVSGEIPDIDVAITGIPALNSDEMSASLQDMTRAMGLALLLVTLLFVAGFGAGRRPLMAVLMLALGIVMTLGWLSLTIGHLTILSMAFGSILVGLGIDFGIHVIARYEKECAEGLDPEEALASTLLRAGRAILSGSLTTAAAFFALCLSRFQGLREFGWIAGWGILFCLATEMVMLPALLLIMDRGKRGGKRREKRQGEISPRLEKVLGWPSRRPGLVVPAAFCLALAAMLSWGRIRFDYNLLHLQARDTEAVEWELKLIEAQGTSSIFAVDMADSLEEARRKAAQYESLSLVNKVESLASYLPADPAARMHEIRRLEPLLKDVVVTGEGASAPSAKRVKRWISRIRFKLREEEGGEEPTGGEGLPLPPTDTLSGARLRTERVLQLLETVDSGTAVSGLARYQERLFSDFESKIGILQASLDPLPVTFEGLPDLLKKRFYSKTGKWLLQIYPMEDIWELEPQRRFVEQLQSVSPGITGPAVQNYDATKSLLDAYLRGGLYAIAAILVILLVDFRNPFFVMLALIPLVIASLWTLLGMQVFGIPFNPANLVIIPLLVGIGVDNGIHVVRHFLGSDSPEDEVAGTSTGRAITLSSLTTMAGFGSLAIARHQGIHSIGALLTLAMASCLVASLVVLPAVLRILPSGTRRRLWQAGQRK
ncbi:MMPL family transporter [Thermodesulfobacteriota bacterium]